MWRARPLTSNLKSIYGRDLALNPMFRKYNLAEILQSVTDFRVTTDPNIATFLLTVADTESLVSCMEANQLRKHFLNNLYAFTVETVTYDENQSCYEDEKLAHILGLCVLKQTLQDLSDLDVVTASLDVSGPKEVTTDDIVFTSEHGSLHWIKTPLLKLREAETLTLTMTIEKGFASDHAKWNPTCICTYIPISRTSFQFTLETVGGMSATEVFELAELRAPEVDVAPVVTEYDFE